MLRFRTKMISPAHYTVACSHGRIQGSAKLTAATSFSVIFCIISCVLHFRGGGGCTQANQFILTVFQTSRACFFFRFRFQQLRLLILVSFTSCKEQVLFIYNQVSLFTEKEDDTYDIVYTSMDTAFLYQGNLHRNLSTDGNSHRYLYRKPLKGYINKL